MPTPKRHHVTFNAEKKVSQPMDVEFVRRDGTQVDFPAHQTVKRTVKVAFMARNKKK